MRNSVEGNFAQGKLTKGIIFSGPPPQVPRSEFTIRGITYFPTDQPDVAVFRLANGEIQTRPIVQPTHIDVPQSGEDLFNARYSLVYPKWLEAVGGQIGLNPDLIRAACVLRGMAYDDSGFVSFKDEPVRNLTAVRSIEFLANWEGERRELLPGAIRNGLFLERGELKRMNLESFNANNLEERAEELSQGFDQVARYVWKLEEMAREVLGRPASQDLEAIIKGASTILEGSYTRFLEMARKKSTLPQREEKAA